MRIAADKTNKDGGELAKTTLFIGGISSNATNDDLIKLFSDIGPVKSAFILPAKGNGL